MAVRTNDTFEGTSGNDTFNPGLGFDAVEGYDGNDLLIINYSVGDTGLGMQMAVNAWSDGAYGSAGREIAVNSPYLDRVSFEGIDRFKVTGTSKNDYISGYVGNDTLTGGGGNDRIANGAGGNDKLDGSAGSDTLVLDLSNRKANTTITNPSTGINLPGIVSSTNFESFHITTGQGNDKLIQAGVIQGVVRRGNDSFLGNDGNDTFNAGLGSDGVDGGNGNDLLIIDYSVGDTGLGMQMAVNAWSDGAYGSAGREIAVNSPYLDRVSFEGIDRFKVTGTSKNDYISGYVGNDTLTGGGGNDSIYGGEGNDTINGGGGNDTLNGGAGNDALNGGAGADRFIYDTGSAFTKSAVGVDVIRSFLRGTDKIILDTTTFSALTSSAGGGLNSSDFATINVAQNAAAIAGGKAARIVFNKFNGNLFYNPNGAATGLETGGLFIKLPGLTTLSGNDFIVQS